MSKFTIKEIVEAISKSKLTVMALPNSNPNAQENLNYIRWKDVWKDKVYFTHLRGNAAKTYRAMAISTPAFLTFKDGDPIDLYILGVEKDGKHALQKVFSGRDIKWTKPL